MTQGVCVKQSLFITIIHYSCDNKIVCMLLYNVICQVSICLLNPYRV